MRLLQVNIFEFRPIVDQQLTAEGLIVLFGPNSAGKTSVLEAVEQLITRAEVRRTDPADPVEAHAYGSVVFDLPAAGVAGSADAETYRWLLCGQHSTERAWDWLGEGTSESIRAVGLTQARAVLAALLADSGAAGQQVDRVLLATSLLDPGVVFIVVHDGGVYLLAREPSLPAEVLAAAAQIAAAPGNDDPLQEIAGHLLTHGSARVAALADSIEVRRSLAAAFPPLIVLDGDSESLSAELARSLPSIHDRMWDLHLPERPIPGMPSSAFGDVDPFLMYPGVSSRELYEADPWLEGLSESGEPLVAGPFGGYDQADWYRVRHSVLAVARMIEAEANRVAPSFVQSQGTIGVEVLPVSAWGSKLHRIRATFTEPDGIRRDLGLVGAGTARWVAAALRLACRRLEAGRRVVIGEDVAPESNLDHARTIVRAAREAPLGQTAVRLEPSDAAGFYVVDEPEAHLHPSAIRSVRDWLTQLAETAATVLVATHSPILLDGPSQLTTRVLVTRGEDGTELRTLTGNLADELVGASEVLGLTEGELLLMTRLALFVEGPHDQIILTEWFADDLHSAGIRVFPVHGVDNVLALADSEIVSALGIRIATLSDDTSVPRASSGRPKTRGERAVARLLREAAAAGVEVRAIGLSRPDILCCLDDEICQQVAPQFPGWTAATTEHAATGTREPWKRWVTSQYGLSLTRDAIRSLAAECWRHGKIPAELSSIMKALAAYAAEPTTWA